MTIFSIFSGTTLKEYLKERETQKNSDSEYLFISRESHKVDRTVINRLFNQYSDKITPHTLRHFLSRMHLKMDGLHMK